jgi:hypothetical protein
VTRHQGGETYLVELRALPDDIPPATRLKRWLKSALRAANFRATRISETTPKLPPLPPPAPAGDVTTTA